MTLLFAEDAIVVIKFFEKNFLEVRCVVARLGGRTSDRCFACLCRGARVYGREPDRDENGLVFLHHMKQIEITYNIL